MSIFFPLIYNSPYDFGCLTRSDLFECLLADHSFIFKLLIDCFLTYLYLYVVSFYSKYCSWYGCGCLLRSNLFVWLWNDFYNITNSLIHSLVSQICMLFLFIWIIVAGMLLAVLQGVITFYDCEMTIILYLVHWLIHHLLRSVCCFFPFDLL